MNSPTLLREIIGHLKDVADRWERGDVTTGEIQTALIQLDGAKKLALELASQREAMDA